MQQIVQTLTMAEDDPTRRLHVLICDRDSKWSSAVRVNSGRRDPRRPFPSARRMRMPYAERFVRSIKEEGLDRLIPIGERHFQRAVVEYDAHYHSERNHQGLDNRLAGSEGN